MKLLQKAKKIKRMGVYSPLLWALTAFRNYLLWKYYSFEKWHIAENYYRRPYKKEIVHLVNQLGVDCVVDLGCGLGEIIARVGCRRRIGIDSDHKVVKAASLINLRHLELRCGSFEDARPPSTLKSLFLMTGIAHNISPDDLEEALRRIGGEYKYLLLEHMDAKIKSYRYHHDFAFLERNGFMKLQTIASDCGEPGVITLFENTRKSG